MNEIQLKRADRVYERLDEIIPSKLRHAYSIEPGSWFWIKVLIVAHAKEIGNYLLDEKPKILSGEIPIDSKP